MIIYIIVKNWAKWMAIASFFSTLFVFISSGIALDRITTAEFKRVVFGHIENNPSEKLSNIKAASNVLQRYSSFIITGNIQSTFARISAITIIFYSICVIFLAVQGINFFEIIWKNVVYLDEKIILIISVIFSSVMINFVSYYQTSVLIKFMSRCKNIWEIISIALSEILASIAVFTFLLPVFLTISTVFLEIGDRFEKTIFIKIQDPSNADNEKFPANTDDDEISKAKFTTQIEIYVKGNPKTTLWEQYYVYSNFNLNVDHVSKLLIESSTPDLTFTELQPGSGKVVLEMSYFGDREKTYNFNSTIQFEPITQFDKFFSFYSAGFRLSDYVQDAFPYSVMAMHEGWINLSHFQYISVLTHHETMASSPNAWCEFNGQLTLANTLDECGNWIATNKPIGNTLTQTIYLKRDESRGGFPISIAFISSLLITIFAYLQAGLRLIIGGTTHAQLEKNNRSRWFNFQEHPFALTAATFGLMFGCINLFF